MCDYLDQHPRVFIPPVKEVHFLAKDFPGERYVTTPDDYRALFADGEGKLCGEGSIWFLYSKSAAREIHERRPDSKIIIMLRNPVDYAHSRHQQSLFNLWEDIADFEQALDAEPDRLRGRRIPKTCRLPWGLFYTESARFAEQVQRYLNVFGIDRVHIILLEDMNADPIGTYRRTLRFLGIDEDFTPAFEVVNPSKRVRSTLVQRVIGDPQLRSVVKSFLPKRYHLRIGRSLLRMNTRYVSREPMPTHVRARLIDTFQPEVAKLSELLKRDLSHWCVPTESG